MVIGNCLEVFRDVVLFMLLPLHICMKENYLASSLCTVRVAKHGKVCLPPFAFTRDSASKAPVVQKLFC